MKDYLSDLFRPKIDEIRKLSWESFRISKGNRTRHRESCPFAVFKGFPDFNIVIVSGIGLRGTGRMRQRRPKKSKTRAKSPFSSSVLLCRRRRCRTLTPVTSLPRSVGRRTSSQRSRSGLVGWFLIVLRKRRPLTRLASLVPTPPGEIVRSSSRTVYHFCELSRLFT